MQNLQISFSAVFPIFLTIALGYILRICKVWGEPTITKLNEIVFRVFLPVHVFLSIYNADFAAVFNGKLVGFVCISILILFLLLSLLIPLIEKEPCRRGVMIQGMMRSNFVILGMPLVAAVFGDAGSAAAAAMISFVIPLFNVLSVITLELNRSAKPNLSRILLGIAKNPLILASVAAVLCQMIGLRFPVLLTDTLTDWGKIATPLALVALGGGFQFSRVRSGIRQLIIAVSARLFLIPAVFVTLGALLGFRGAELMVIAAVFGAPTAVSSFPMAQAQGGDGELAGQIVVFTSVLSMFSLFLFIFLLKTFQFI